MKKNLSVWAFLLILPLAAFAGGSQESAVDANSVNIGLFVADSFGDRAFYDIGLDGAVLIKEKYGIECAEYEGRLQADSFELLLNTAAKENDLVFVLGFEAMDAMLKVAENSSETLFVFIDSVVDSPYVVSLGYKDHEGTALAGALAAMFTTDPDTKFINKDKKIGYIGGVDSPVMQRAIWGFEQGAHYVDESVDVDAVFVGSWVDPAKGKEANLALIEKGNDIIFQYAGLSGEGGFNAAKEGSPLWVIGGGCDQRWLAPDNTIASVMKAVDYSMDYLTGEFLKGNLHKGDMFNWGVKEKGMYLEMSEDLIPSKYVEAVKSLEKEIQAGEVVISEFRD